MAMAAAGIVDAIVIGFGVKSVKAFAEAQATTAQLEQVIKTTGKSSSMTAEGVHNLAMKLEEYSGQTHDAIEKGQTILLQYDGITNKTLPAASKAMVDLSQRMGIDQVSAAKLLGLALTDPEAGITRLRRSGVVLSASIKEQIKTMQKSGDTAGAAALLMSALESKVGGAGGAYRNTLAGGVAEAKAKLTDFEELLGGKIIKTLDEAYQWYQKHSKIINFLAETIGTLVGVLATILFLYGNWLLLLKSTEIIMKVLNATILANPWTMIATAIVLVAILILEHWNTVKKWFGEFTQVLKSWFGDVTSDLKQWWKDVADVVIDVWDHIKVAIKDVLDWFGNRIEDVTGFIEKHKKVIIDWSIVIGTILLPKIVAIGVQMTVAAANAIVAFVTMAASATANSAVSSAAWVVSAAKSAAAWIADLPKMIAQFAVASVEATVNAAKVTASWVISAAQTAVAWAINFAEFAAGMAVMVAQFLIQAARMAIGWLMAMGPIGLIVAIVAGVVALIIANFDTVKRWFNEFVSWFKQHWDLIVSFIFPFMLIPIEIIKHWQTIVDWFRGLGSMIKGAVGNLGNLLYDVGKSIVQGLINGVKDMGEHAKNAVKDIAKGMKDAAKKVLNIFSPSQVFHEIGVNVGQGLINGMNSMTDMVGAASGSMAMAAVIPAAGVVNNASNSSTVNTTISGPINIASNVDANNFMQRLTSNQELAMKGLTPVK